ncbi:hypothetical protein F485_gp287 [Aeromonas phage CC2]|uniref:Uncharacterized protein n=4 Tax=Caudoviricetes TaxID=2731619 RepID=I6WB67_9CAUD|nr:hypothetical protein F485_gp287 [Aeromonas phage CC2]YP_009834561.1 hypothetical protein HWB28_gp261 [Aeromonas phage AS-zj]YP_009834792.1 hypothetical protein HWB29_gp090 [Aeromonas phage AS-sw]QAX98815.1 hypothetical protein assk_9 [Aeromonas phage Assk]UKM62782.1 hypothetical protein P19_0294 [Aeromonas phage P19]AFN39165.1 hypothetical protein CC2_008 [Aeromonas phage CC2]ASU00291.1 hypothetical protein [Aeromonas phage AS-zj]ATI18140.1 hypothetical protein [Aeromonas phage AS-sw]
MCSKEELRFFLMSNYRHSRFKDRNTGFWIDYQDIITDNHNEALLKYGRSMISQHDSINGQILVFDKDLNKKYIDYVETPKQSQTLTHLF